MKTKTRIIFYLIIASNVIYAQQLSLNISLEKKVYLKGETIYVLAELFNKSSENVELTISYLLPPEFIVNNYDTTKKRTIGDMCGLDIKDINFNILPGETYTEIYNLSYVSGNEKEEMAVQRTVYELQYAINNKLTGIYKYLVKGGIGEIRNWRPDYVHLASNTPGYRSDNNKHSGYCDISINIEADRAEYYKGQYIDILAAIKNNGSDTVKINLDYFHFCLYDIDNHKLYPTTLREQRNRIVTLLPGRIYKAVFDPKLLISMKTPDDMRFNQNVWKEGNYELYLIVSDFTEEFNRSNAIKIKILPVPNGEEQAYYDLVRTWEETRISSQLTIEEITSKHEELFNQYKSSVYYQDYLKKMTENTCYMGAINNFSNDEKFSEEAISSYKEFILNFPQKGISYYKFRSLSRNKNVSENDIIQLLNKLNELEAKSPQGQKLRILELIENRMEYENEPRLNKILNEN